MMNLKFRNGLPLAGAALLALTPQLSARADYPGTVLSQGPVGYWRLNETTQPQPNAAANLGSLGSSANGTYNSLPTRGLTGPFTDSLAVGFNGLGQSVSTPWQAALNNSSFSVELWVNPAQVPYPGSVAYVASSAVLANPRSGWYLAQDNGTTFGANSAFVVRFFNQNGTTPTVQLAAPCTNSVGSWYHLVLTYDGTTATLYENGVAVTNHTAAYVPNVSAPFTVGMRSDNGFPWPGQAAEVAMYGTALSAQRVSTHYTTATTTPANYVSTVQADAPLVYYRFREPPDPQAANLGSLGSAGNGAYVYKAMPGQIGLRNPPYPGFDSANNSVGFDGTGGYVSLPALNLDTNTVTITAWVLATNPQPKAGGIVLSRAGTTVAGITFDSVNTSGLELTYNWNDDPSAYNWLSGLSLPASDWGFVALIVQPDHATLCAANNTDANSFATAVNTMTHVAQKFEGATLLGADSGFTDRYLSGRIDEVAIFNRALGVGEVFSQYASAVGGVAPRIFADPQAPVDTLFEGDTLTLTVDAGGTPGVGYQWRKNNVVVSAGTSATFTKANLTTADSGSYDVVVTNAIGSIISQPANITVTALSTPAISQSPIGRTMYAGGTLTLSVIASGGQLVYHWQKDGSPFPAASNATYVVNGATAADSGSYVVTVSNRLGTATSTPAAVTVIAPASGSYAATILADAPEAWWRLDEPAGSSTMFDGMGRHDGTYNGVTLGTAGLPASGGDTAATFTGASGDFSSVPYAAALNAAEFTIECWAKTTDLSTTMVPVSTHASSRGCYIQTSVPSSGLWAGGVASGGNEYYVPSPSTQPMQSGVWTHLAMTFSTSVGLRFYVNGEYDGINYVDFDRNTAGAFIIGGRGVSPGGAPDTLFTGQIDEVAVYTKALSQARLQTHYSAGLFGGNTKPIFTYQPLSRTVALGTTVSFNPVVQGTLPIGLQWQKNGSPISGATTTSYSITNVQYADAGNYQLVATNIAGSTTSTVATLTVLAPPTFANVTNGLVLHLKFDGNYDDASGLGHTASAAGTPGTPTFLTPGQIGTGAIQVDTLQSAPETNYVAIAAAPDLTFGPNDSFAVAFWVKYTGTPDDLPMIGNSVNSTYQKGWVFADDSGKLIWSLVGADAGSIIIDQVGPAINNGSWHHILGSIDRSTQTADTYVDGVLVDTRSIAALGTLDNGHPIAIGQDPTGAYKVDGTFGVDDVGIWRKALTTYDAQSIYLAGKNSHASFDTAPPPTVTITMARSGSSVTLSWSTGTLWQSDTLGASATWTVVTGASAPSYTFTPGSGNKFFRVQIP